MKKKVQLKEESYKKMKWEKSLKKEKDNRNNIIVGPRKEGEMPYSEFKGKNNMKVFKKKLQKNKKSTIWKEYKPAKRISL